MYDRAIGNGGFCAQGGINNQTFVGCVLERDLVVVTAVHDAKPGGRNHIAGQPMRQVYEARTGVGVN